MKVRRFTDKVAVITGSAQGIGLATAERFSQEGADIVAVDLHGVDFDAVSRIVEGNGRNLSIVEADVSSQSDWRQVVEKADVEYGRIDVLVNCAGIAGALGGFEDVTLKDFEKVMAVNVTGTFLGMQAVTPTMKAQNSGSIVNISSISGERGNPRITAYTTSKHAVNGLSKCAALDLIQYGIRVNVVSPAPIDTAMMKQAEDAAAARLNIDAETARKMMSSNLVMGRYGQPAEIAATVAYLCSEDASFMTGAVVAVDGGALAR
ncbi:MAG: SDR family oxidoreductase [Chloroflexota bacterium]